MTHGLAIGDVIEWARRSRGWSQRELARRSGVPQRTISHYEAGVAPRYRATLDALAKVLGLDADALAAAPPGRLTDWTEPEPEMPRLRSECADGPRPCPWYTCRYHLGTYSRYGGVAVRIDPDTIDDTTLATCALDLTSEGGMTLTEVGEAVGHTRERVRQLQVGALRQVAQDFPQLGDYFGRLEAAAEDEDEMQLLHTRIRFTYIDVDHRPPFPPHQVRNVAMAVCVSCDAPLARVAALRFAKRNWYAVQLPDGWHLLHGQRPAKTRIAQEAGCDECWGEEADRGAA